MTFAFSRDGAIPGSKRLAKVNKTTRIPANAVIFVARHRRDHHPAGAEERRVASRVAFYAVVSVAVIGLYLAFLIPIWLRWRMGDAFEPGPGPTARSTSG